MRKSFLNSLLIVLILSLVFLGTGSVGAAFPSEIKEYQVPTGAEYVQDEILVKFRGVDRIQRIKIRDDEQLERLIERYNQRFDVEYAEPNFIAYKFFVPNDPYYPYQWHLDSSTGSGGVSAEEAWDIADGSGVTVAVVDTGVAYESYSVWNWSTWTFERYYQAPDLAGTNFVPGYDFVENDAHPNDDEGHGTHVTGTIAQTTDNRMGVAGLAHKARVMPVKVLDKNGTGTYLNVADGIKFAADNGAKVINLSLGGSAPSTTLEDAVRYAYEKGVTVIASAGNNNSQSPSYPAGYNDYVVAVGATRYDETRSYYSNYGPTVDIVAPGGDITVDQNGDGYGDGVLQQTFGTNRNEWAYYFYQGTSMAAPHASGVAALILSNGIAGTPDEVRNVLESTAKDLGAPGRDNIYGWGLINAAAALGYTPAPADTPPTVSLTSPTEGTTIIGSTSITADASDDNQVERVEFFVDGSLIGSDTTNFYEVSWDSTTVGDGSHALKATAFDNIGQSSSSEVNVTVDNINDPPVANAGPNKTVSDSNGSGSESVTLDGSASFDPDGTIISYEWSESGSVLGTSALLTSNFAVGTHNLTLTVTDDKGAVGSDETIVSVLANQSPTADAGPDKSTTVGQLVNFNGSGSSDPDGTIVSYEWDFGDGSPIATGVAVSHSYATANTYTVTLTVTDNGGLQDSDNLTVTVTEPPSANVVINSVQTRDIKPWRFYRIQAYLENLDSEQHSITAHVEITDPNGDPVSWDGLDDQAVILNGGQTKTITWWGRVTDGMNGIYTAKVDVLKNGAILDSQTATFKGTGF